MTAMTHPPVAPAVSAATPSRWPLAGIGAGICGLAMIVTSMNFGVSDDERILADPERFAVVMQDQRQYLVPFVVATTVGALLLVVFAASALLGNGTITTANLDALASAVAALTGSGDIE